MGSIPVAGAIKTRSTLVVDRVFIVLAGIDLLREHRDAKLGSKHCSVLPRGKLVRRSKFPLHCPTLAVDRVFIVLAGIDTLCEPWRSRIGVESQPRRLVSRPCKARLIPVAF